MTAPAMVVLEAPGEETTELSLVQHRGVCQTLAVAVVDHERRLRDLSMRGQVPQRRSSTRLATVQNVAASPPGNNARRRLYPGTSGAQNAPPNEHPGRPDGLTHMVPVGQSVSFMQEMSGSGETDMQTGFELPQWTSVLHDGEPGPAQNSVPGVPVPHVAPHARPPLAHVGIGLHIPSEHDSPLGQVPHVIEPPQPSGAVPHCWPAGQVVVGVQLHVPAVQIPFVNGGAQGLPSGVTRHEPAESHVPGWHASMLHSGVNTQPVAGSQLSVVQAILSSQVFCVWRQRFGFNGSQLSVVQALWSSQLIGVNTQPLAGLQVSLVHGLWSLQTTAVCVQAQTPCRPSSPLRTIHVPSSVVHALLSLQRMLGQPDWQLPRKSPCDRRIGVAFRPTIIVW